MYHTWSCSYIATVGISTHYPSAPATFKFQVSTSSGDLNPRANFSHCLDLEIGSFQVLIAMCKTAMTHTRLPGVSVTFLLVSHDATNEQTSPASVPIGPWDLNSVACALCPFVKKFNPTGVDRVVQPNLSS